MNKLVIIILNQLFQANPRINSDLKQFTDKTIELQVIGIAIRFMVSQDYMLKESYGSVDTMIVIPLAAGSYLIDQNQLKSFNRIQIHGDQKLGQNWIKLMSRLEVTNILYQHDSVLLGVFAVQVERLLASIIDYLKLMTGNASYSVSQYLQYESDNIVGKYELKQFCAEVDELNSRYQLLNKRMERLHEVL